MVDKKTLAQQHTEHNEQNWTMNNWRAWGSWFSWGSPVGLTIFIVGLACAIWILAHI